MKEKRFGYSLYEIILTLSILIIILSISFIKYRNFKEKRDFIYIKNEIIENIKFYSIESLSFRKRHPIAINIFDKKIEISDETPKLLKTIKMPKKLSFYITKNQNADEIFEFYLRKNGNTSASFSIYIFGYDGKVKYRYSFYGFEETKFLKINVYKNIGAKNIDVGNITAYHELVTKDRDLFNRDWRLEN